MRLMAMLMLTLFSCFVMASDVYKINTVAHPPYIYPPSYAVKGEVLELTQAAFDLAGLNSHFVWYNDWQLGLDQTIEVDSSVFTAGVRTPERERLYTLSEPLLKVNHSFYGHTRMDWTYEGVESLEGLRIGIIRGWSYGDIPFDVAVEKDKLVGSELDFHEYNDAPHAITALYAGWVDLIVMPSKIAEHNFTYRFSGLQNHFENKSILTVQDLYLLWNKTTSESVISSVDRGIRIVTRKEK